MSVAALVSRNHAFTVTNQIRAARTLTRRTTGRSGRSGAAARSPPPSQAAQSQPHKLQAARLPTACHVAMVNMNYQENGEYRLS